jgi:hypothetical protein
VPNYRFYKLDRHGKVHRGGVDFTLDDDAAAMDHGQKIADGLAVEIWDGTRRVGAIPKAPKN